MTRQIRLFLCTTTAVFALLANPSLSQGQYAAPPANQQRGAIAGGLAGAVAGGLIGDNNDKAGAGAAIGGVLGAVAGGLFGNARDKEIQYQQGQQQYYQQQQTVAAQSAVSINDIVSMSRSGLGEAVIINQIQSRGVITQPQVPDIIAMHQQGVSERVITAMQQAPTGAQRVARTAIPAPIQRVYTPSPVIVQEHVVLPHYPAPHYSSPHVYHHYHGHGHQPARRSGVHIRF